MIALRLKGAAVAKAHRLGLGHCGTHGADAAATCHHQAEGWPASAAAIAAHYILVHCSLAHAKVPSGMASSQEYREIFRVRNHSV